MAITAPSIDALYQNLLDKLRDTVPEAELAYKAELAWEINQLKRERGAVILGHNYMEPALFHSVCDFTGDSLELCRKAMETEADPIVFCGVGFMAETAKILNPERTVLLPAKEAGCSLAASITAEDVRALKERFPGVPVVTYINTYADVKAETDICCTSGNAARVVASLESDTVIFIPDEYLARNVARETGKKIIVPSVHTANGDGPALVTLEGANGTAGAAGTNGAGTGPATDTVIGWGGRCEVHDQFTVQDVSDVRAQFPDVVVLAHPECRPEVVEAADFAGSTSAMLNYVRTIDAPRYLLLTECSMGDNIAAEMPQREMLRLCSVRCPHMNMITLEGVLAALKEDKYVVEVPEPIMSRARQSIERMLAI
jgi:quinolinate synthase